MMALAPVRSDTLPENSTYRDDGCDVSPTCLNCPLPICKYDDPDYIRRAARSVRDRSILETRRLEGLSVPALAQRFGVSTRTVHRVLQFERLGSLRRSPTRPAVRLVSGTPTRSFRIPAPLPEIWPVESSYSIRLRMDAGGVREGVGLRGAA